MNACATTAWVMVAAVATSATCAADSQPADPRLREVLYDPRAVVTVPVKRGVVTLVVLDADESITEVAAGLGGDCSKTEAAWCVAAQPGGRNLFVKAKRSASAPNNLAVVTDRRTHSFRFVVLADNDPKAPVYRLVVKAPVAPQATPGRLALRDTLPLVALPAVPPAPPPKEVIAERIGYMVDKGQGSKAAGRQPWDKAAEWSCPSFAVGAIGFPSGAQRGQTRRFVEKVLKIKGE